MYTPTHVTRTYNEKGTIQNFKPQTSYELTNIMLTLKLMYSQELLEQVRLAREDSALQQS